MLTQQIIALFIIALPIACISWTVTHEEIFAGPRNFCVRQSKENRNVLLRKCFYLFTCEYCFSHYITAIFLVITGYTLLFTGWKGYLIGGFALVWIANFYMGLFGLLRQTIKAEKTKINLDEKIIEKQEKLANSNNKTNSVNGKKGLFTKKSSVDHWNDI